MHLTTTKATSISLFLLICSSHMVVSQVMIEAQNETTDTNTTDYEYEDYGCATGEFDCGNGECILETQVCDRIVDCGDGLDESNCTGSITGCNDDQVDCGDGFCIYKHQLCDGKIHCFNSTDEKDCDSSSPISTTSIPVTTSSEKSTTEDYGEYSLDCEDYEFACNDECIDESLVCDGTQNCFDGEDELDCPTESTTTTTSESTTKRIETTSTVLTSSTLHGIESTTLSGKFMSSATSSNNGCEENQFRCTKNKCISDSLVCDGKQDCDNNSDEYLCAEASSTTLISKMLTHTTPIATTSDGCRYKGQWYSIIFLALSCILFNWR